MSTQNWITLMEYSAKHRVSLSTLRRRIKAGEIENKFQDGKYLLLDYPTQTAQAINPRSESIAPPTSIGAPNSVPNFQPAAVPHQQPQPTTAGVDPDQFWRTTHGLLNEIKKAYSLVLQEKEEQMLQLKEEVADLKTLVRVLEDENLRIKNLPTSNLDLELGLEI